VKVPVGLRDELRRMADEDARTLSDFCCLALYEYVEQAKHSLKRTVGNTV